MKIKIYAVARKCLDCEEYVKMARAFGAEIEIINIFNAKIQNAQKINAESAQIAYQNECEKYISPNSFTQAFALDARGEMLDSAEFSEILRSEISQNEIKFFIGGAYGFGADFLRKVRSISLSKLTFSHKIVPLILCEQIYRALSIINHHPYHK